MCCKLRHYRTYTTQKPLHEERARMTAMVFNDRKLRALPRPTKEEGQRTLGREAGGWPQRAVAGAERQLRRSAHMEGGLLRRRQAALGEARQLSRDDALRRHARRRASSSRRQEDGLQPGRAKSFGEVAKVWLQERVDRRGLRSAREIRRHIEQLCAAALGEDRDPRDPPLGRERSAAPHRTRARLRSRPITCCRPCRRCSAGMPRRTTTSRRRSWRACSAIRAQRRSRSARASSAMTRCGRCGQATAEPTILQRARAHRCC